MKPKTALLASLVAMGITALCCFTPILVVIMSILGLSAWVGCLDYILLPALGIFAGLSLWSFWRYRRCCRKSS